MMPNRLALVFLLLLVAAIPARGQTPTPSPSAVAEPTQTPCVEVPEAKLVFQFTVDPPDVVVGDVFTLTVLVQNAGDGLAGLPHYTLLRSNPLLAVNSEGATGPPSLGSNTVTYHLTALAAGVAQLQVTVSYESARGCPNHPLFFFTSATSQALPVPIAQARPTPTPTLTAPIPVIPSPASPAGVALVVGLGVAIAWMVSRPVAG